MTAVDKVGAALARAVLEDERHRLRRPLAKGFALVEYRNMRALRGIAHQRGAVVWTGLASLAYLLTVPPVPDLAAQVTRAEMVRQSGFAVWWPGWFGGLQLPTYSGISPPLMAVLGAPLTGAIAAVVASMVMNELLRGTARPRAGSVTFAGMVLLNLLGGRITFLVGLAAGLLALLAMIKNRVVIAPLLGVLTCLSSPLAALFLGLAAVTRALTSRDGRRVAILLATAVAATAALLWVLFSGAGVMPSPAIHMALSLLCIAVVALLCPSRPIRVGAGLLALTVVLAMIVPTAVGLNATRLSWLVGAPLIAAEGRLPRMAVTRRSSTRWVAGLTVAASLYPAIDVAQQVFFGQDRSASREFYEPLLAQLRTQLRADPASFGQRVEVVEPRTKGASRYVAVEFPIARGWDRQADRANNELFYGAVPLTAPSYRAWLDQLAVGWVAVPSAPLDGASVAESRLVRAGLPYLVPVWTSPDWVLYRVTQPQPLARGARVLGEEDGRITLRVPRAGDVPVRIRWSRHLQVRRDPPVAGPPPTACLARADGWLVLRAFEPGDYTIGSGFNPPLIGEAGTACPDTDLDGPVPTLPSLVTHRGPLETR